MIDLGTVRPGRTIRIPFGSFAASTGAPSATTNYAAADIQVYKDGSTTQRASSSGMTATTDFDTLTGINLVTIDLSDNTTADFWAAGSEYIVVISDITVDSQTLRFPIARFRIGFHDSIRDTTIATLASQTSFTLTTGPADNNALVGCTCVISAAASAVQMCMGVISAYVGASKTITLAADPGIYTIAAKDNISIFNRANMYAVGGLASLGQAGYMAVDWGQVANKTTSNALTGTTIATTQKVDIETIKTNPVVNAGTVTFPTTATLASTTNITAGTVTTATNVTTVNGLAAGVITASSIAADAITAAKIADGAIDAATFAAGAINAAAIATDAIDADALATDAVTEIWAKSMTELSAVPGVTASVLSALTWLFEISRNKITQTATTQLVKKDDGTTTLATSTVSDDGTTFTRGVFS